jgi:VanZ family protein
VGEFLFSSRKIYFFGALGYLLFVVYGSLVPLDFHPRPFDMALRDFARIPYLRLGMESRADWVANLLLYIPLSYLLLGCAMGERRFVLQTFFSFVVFGFCVALCIGIEFAQLFFPPRTVSLNDIFAEILGSALGVLFWWGSGHKLRRLLDLLLSQGRSAAYAGSILYAIAYLAFSLFPFDFLISAQEIRAKLASPYFHWFASTEACGSSLRCGVKLMAEVAAVAPLGFLFGLMTRKCAWGLFIAAASIGFWLGLTIESLQFFLVSGVTLGASVFTRIIGVTGGALVGEMLAQTSLWPLLYFFGPLMPLTLVVYMALLAAVTWVGKGPLLNVDQGLNRLHEIYFMPFYYHYYTTESAAMTSLIGIAVMFFPVGALFWVWRITRIREFAARGALQVALLSAAISGGLEIGKLFLGGARPDPTNVLIAAAAGAAGFLALSICTNASLKITASSEDVSLNESN